VRRGHYTIVGIECQIFVAVKAVVGGWGVVVPGFHRANIKISLFCG